MLLSCVTIIPPTEIPEALKDLVGVTDYEANFMIDCLRNQEHQPSTRFVAWQHPHRGVEVEPKVECHPRKGLSFQPPYVQHQIKEFFAMFGCGEMSRKMLEKIGRNCRNAPLEILPPAVG
jgi:hypothetical protein